MSTLTPIEKRKLEKFFRMSSGYVLDFSDATFGNFFVDTLGIDIHADKYHASGSSKAKKLREFWRIESDLKVGKAVSALVDYAEDSHSPSVTSENVERTDNDRKALVEQCRNIANRLLSADVNLSPLKESAERFDAKHLDDQIQRMEQAVQSDPALAIGTAKELVETCCKTILVERGIEVSGGATIPTLTKQTLKELRLVPDEVSDATRGAKVIKRLLQDLGTIGNSLAELRGLYGTGHGKHANAKGLSPRHAKLAVGAAATLVTFLFETHREGANEEVGENHIPDGERYS